MKIINHRHTGLIVNNFDLMLNFYKGMGLSLRRHDLEEGEFIDQLLGAQNIILETAKLVIEDKNSIFGYSFQLELMKLKNKINLNSYPEKDFDIFQREMGVLDLAFTVDDICGAQSFILENGGGLIGLGPVQAKTGFPALHCYAYDPEGNILHIVENLAPK